jgi:hypothetical protein
VIIGQTQFSIQKLLRALTPGSPAGEVPYQDVTEGIAQEELKGLSYMFWGRLVALALLAVWALTLPFERSAGIFRPSQPSRSSAHHRTCSGAKATDARPFLPRS